MALMSRFNKRESTDKILTVAPGTIGSAAGWTVSGGTLDVGAIARMAASQTAGKLVVPVAGLKVGDTIEGFHALGQIESAGGTVTLDISLRKVTMAAADPTDSLVASMTQLSVTADTLVDKDNTTKSGFYEEVAEGTTYYWLLTATTAGSTDIQLMGLAAVVRSEFKN